MEDLIFKDSKVIFEDENLQACLNDFECSISEIKLSDLYFLLSLYRLSFAWKGSLIYYLQKTTKGEKYTFYQFMQKHFNLNERYIQKCFNVLKRFTSFGKTGDVAGLTYLLPFNGFSLSKLFELLVLSDSQLEKDISNKILNCNMTVKQIRDYIKSIKGGPKKDNKVLEDNSSEEETEVTDCGQYIKFSSENFDYIKQVIKGKKYNYKDTSSFLNALLKYAREKELFL